MFYLISLENKNYTQATLQYIVSVLVSNSISFGMHPCNLHIEYVVCDLTLVTNIVA